MILKIIQESKEYAKLETRHLYFAPTQKNLIDDNDCYCQPKQTDDEITKDSYIHWYSLQGEQVYQKGAQIKRIKKK